MKIIGMMMARNEAWILPASIPAAMQWLDELVILNHASTDDTAKIVKGCFERYPGRIHPESVNDADWNEADLRQLMLSRSRALGATHIASIDADEIATVLAMRSIKDRASNLNPGEMLRVPWLQCWRSIDRYRCDESAFGRARVPLVFADHPSIHYSSPGGYRLHSRIPHGCKVLHWGEPENAGVMHFQHAKWDRVVAKQLWYQMTEVLRWPGLRTATEIASQYAPTTNEYGVETCAIPESWWPVDKTLIDMNAEPWQIKECQRLIEKHGRERFAGLPL